MNPNFNIGNNHNTMNNNEIIFNTVNNPNNNRLNNKIFETDNNNLFIANSNIVNQKYLCKKHGEPISYLCLDCLSRCICSECIVHGFTIIMMY